MAQKNGKGRRKSIRNQRWASVVAAIIAVGMLLSAAVFGMGGLFSGGSRDSDPGLDLEAYRDSVAREVENRESYIEQYGPTAAVLTNLVQKYHELIYVQELVAMINASAGESDRLSGYQEALVLVYRSLIELAPEEPEHHLGFLDVYRKVEKDETLLLAEIFTVRELLHRKPDPLYNLSLIGLLQSLEQDEMVQEEAVWLQDYMEPKLADGDLESIDRYYYAWLMGEYLDNREVALEQLNLILAVEPESGELYQAAQRYQERLQESAGD